MKLSAAAVFIVLCFMFRDCFSQVDRVTFSSKPSEKLDCTISSNTQSAVWNEEAVNGSRIATVYTYNRDSGITPETPPGKYNNFEYNFVENTSFDLIIETVEKDDGGRYRCLKLPSTDAIIYNVDVEALPDSITIFCSSLESCSETSGVPVSNFNCVCTASEVSENLELVWSGAPLTPEPFSSDPEGNYFNLIGEAAVNPEEGSGEISCSVSGYKSIGIEDDSVKKTYKFAPPECTLLIDCSSAMLTCNCSGQNPPEMTYIFYDESMNSIATSSGNQITADSNIVPGASNTFFCQGCNGVFYGESSLVNNTIDCPATQPTGSTTTTKKDNGTGTENGDNNPPVVVIVVIVIVVIIILITVGGFIYWMVFKRNKNRTESKNAVTATTGDTTSSAPVYGVIDKSKKKKSDKTDGNGMPMSEAPEYAAVDKPLNSEPKPAPRSSQPPPNNSTEKELQYADIDHSSRTPSNQIRQPAEAPTEYATVQSVIV